MFWNHKQQQTTTHDLREQFAVKLDTLIADAIAGRVDIRQLCDVLESRTQALRARWALNAPLDQAW